MNANSYINDAAQRELALDPGRSFIVQAPAGSGKTELLIQRYLRLLAIVESPEEIIAITFTRKAAAEMRSRILDALDSAQNGTAPETFHEYKTWELARGALEKNDHCKWMIKENPARFKIQTIDSLCAGLTRQMPVLSKFGGQPKIIENADPLYRQAAANTIADLETGEKWSSAIEALVRHLDNHLEKVEALIAGMLAKRDQWLRHMGEKHERSFLENALADMVRDVLDSILRQLPESGLPDLLDLCRFAAGNLKSLENDTPICDLADLNELPDASPENKSKWLGICELLLTQSGEWRKTVTKNTGFPAPSSAKSDKQLKALFQAKKELFRIYVETLAENENLASALHAVRSLPEPRYSEAQWNIMEALFEILAAAVNHLEIVFGESGQVDFAEIALRAGKALGEPDFPTDLMLALDYRISHILVDEFQDTSYTQYELLESLTAGWEPGDGRTFFAVGDPMQSIYGFREAEVGLFMKARQEGLGQIKLHPVTLMNNFRSQKKIVDWINESFTHVMPKIDDVTTGAVSYSPSVASRDALDGEAVVICPFIPADQKAEADAIVACIKDAREFDLKAKIAILVRGRSHLEAIVPAIKSAGIAFRAVEIESLKNRPMITDLIALARALSHPADKIAWLAILRAPWCGLTLNDLYALAGEDSQRTILDLMADESRLSSLSADGQVRLARVRKILFESIDNRQRKTFRRQVEGVWLRLGGLSCALSETDLEDVSAFFDLLEDQAGAGALTDVTALEDAASKLFAIADTQADDSLQIMTIHKAKGLEFDIVILPGLERTPPSPDPQLLLWLERYLGRESQLLLAPIAETGGEPDKIYNYIKLLYEQKRDFEDTRLLYVAATRAKKRLYLMGGASIGKTNDIMAPGRKSLLAKLWPAAKTVFENALAEIGTEKVDKAATESQSPQIIVESIRRFKDDFYLPSLPLDEAVNAAVPAGSDVKDLYETPIFDWAGEIVRRVGTVIHQWLKMICEDGVEGWTSERIARKAGYIRQDLARAGINPDDLSETAETVISALVKTVSDERGRWILSAHQHSACEFALTGRIDDKIVSCVMDRTFVDEKGTRWIIDYKSGIHSGGSLENFLDQEKMRYFSQMQLYAKLMAAHEDKPLRLGLYFPQLNGWREWQ